MPCRVCGSPAEAAFRARDFNRRRSDCTFTYARCSQCRLVFLANPPDDLYPYYAGDYLQLPSRTRLGHIARKERHRLRMLTPWVKGGRMVEIGPAHGAFALQARQAGFNVNTIEMDGECCRYLRSVVGVGAIQSDRPDHVLRKLPSSDAIAMWQVIEHLREPWKCLDEAIENLERGGVLLVATPNPDSLGFRLLGRFWPHLDAPRHLNLIPLELLTERLSARGLERVGLWTDDPSARRWNRFGWQRVLMNLTTNRAMRGLLFGLGAAVAAIIAPVERRDGRSSSYTAVFRKEATT